MASTCDRLNHTLLLLANAVQAAEDNKDTSIEAWETLRLTYKDVHKGSRENVQSFESWGLANIDAFLINRIGEWIHTAHFKSLSEPKKAELRKIAKAFDTDIWMIYFVLGDGLISNSVKGLKGILRCRRVVDELTLESLLNGLEAAREERRGNRSRNVSNDMTKFTLNDVKCCELALCPMPLSPPSSSGDRDSATPDPEPATPNLQTPCRNPPQLKRKSIRRLNAQRLENPQTPPDTDESDSGDDIDIEQGRRCAPVFDVISFSSDEVVGDCDHCVGKHSTFSHSPTEISPLFNKSAYAPIPFSSSDGDDGSLSDRDDRIFFDNIDLDDGSPDISERDDDRVFFDNMDQDANSDFYLEMPEKASQRLSKLWGKPGKLLTRQRVAVLEPRHLQEFDDNERLTDEVVNYCMSSLLESSAITSKIFSQPSFFYTSLLQGSYDTIDHGSVSRWPGIQSCVSLYNAEYLVLPIYDQTIQHWLLAIAGNMTPGERLLAGPTGDVQRPIAFVTVLDSLGSRTENMRIANHIRSYICLEAGAKFDMELDESCIEIKLPKQVLQQNNDRDCGFYVLEHTRRFLADPVAFLQRVFRGRLATLFDVTMLRAQLAGGIIQDKQQQDLDDGDVAAQRDVMKSREVTYGSGFLNERQLGLQIDKGLDAEGGEPRHSLNLGDGEAVATKHIGVGAQKGVDGRLDAEVDLERMNPQQYVDINSTTPQHPDGKKYDQYTEFDESEENLDPEVISNDQSQQATAVSKWRSLETQMVNPKKRGMLQVEDSNMILPIHSRTPASPKSPYCMEQNFQYKRRCTKAHSPDLNMDEVSPQMVVQMIITTKELTQLAMVPLLQDHGQPDLVDSRIWRVLQNFITKLTLQSDLVIDPINIIKDMGFPCVAHLSGEFCLSHDEVSHKATSVLPNSISAASASHEEQDSCENHSYLQCLSGYILSAERAIASAQVLRELVRRSENTVQSLQIEYKNDIEHLRKFAPPPSTIRHHTQANVDKEMALLLHGLKTLFESTQYMVGELKEYRLQLQVAQKAVLEDKLGSACGAAPRFEDHLGLDR